MNDPKYIGLDVLCLSISVLWLVALLSWFHIYLIYLMDMGRGLVG